MKRIKIVLLILLSACLIPVLISCGEMGTISEGTSSTVDDRFKESIDGDTKPIILPRARNTDHFSFLWLTDMHIRPDRKDYFSQLGTYSAEHNSRFIITSGDLTDGGEKEQYEYVLNQVKAHLMIPFYSAIGNHDLYGDGWDAFKEYIGPSVAKFKFGNSLFILVDTASCEVGRDQFDWLEDTLKNSHAKHKFIFTHMCLYNKVAELPIILCDPDERYHMESLLKKYKVDFYLCGHGHYAEETKIGDTIHIQGATASAWNTPMNGDPEFFNFTIDGDDVDYEKIYFKDIEY